jgi:hypothetical protein
LEFRVKKDTAQKKTSVLLCSFFLNQIPFKDLVRAKTFAALRAGSGGFYLGHIFSSPSGLNSCLGVQSNILRPVD